jgi:hypothetical protein
MSLKVVPLLALALAASGCGEVARSGRSPVQVVIQSLVGASGAAPDELGNPVLSDIITNVTSPAPCSATSPCATFFNDLGEVTMSLVLKDPGQPGLPASPSDLNQVTFTRYRVSYRRSDGRSQQGVDVPYAFDSAVTFTVPAQGTVSVGFELVRNIAKREAPLLALRESGAILSTVADVSFYGADQAGNEITVTGSIAVNFGNFADRD